MGATYYARKDRGRSARKSWVVVVRWQGERELKIVYSEQDAKDLVRHVHKQELAGINVIEALRRTRAQQGTTPATVTEPADVPDAARSAAGVDRARSGLARSAAEPRRRIAHGWRRGSIRISCRMAGCSPMCP
jgi:hypothetical protein